MRNSYYLVFDGSSFPFSKNLPLKGHYDPLTAQWLQQDRFRGLLEVPQSLHRYMYVHGSPTNYVDEDGYIAWIPIAFAALVVADYALSAWDAYQINRLGSIEKEKRTPEQDEELQALEAGMIIGQEIDNQLAMNPPQISWLYHAGVDDVVRKGIQYNAKYKLTQKADEAFTGLKKAGSAFGEWCGNLIKKFGDDVDVVVPRGAHPDISYDETGRAIINNRRVRVPKNFDYPGVYHPPGLDGISKYADGIYIDEAGFPDFTPYSKLNVTIEMTGNYADDFDLANAAAGFDTLPEGYTWHHHQDGTTMMLVPSELNSPSNVPHTGGAALFRD